jgi:hypothetical protein
MSFALRSVLQMLVMSAIVTTALFVPLGTLLALVCFALFRVGVLDFVTFGGFLNAGEGVAAWWVIFFLPALVYSAYVMPWHARGS